MKRPGACFILRGCARRFACAPTANFRRIITICSARGLTGARAGICRFVTRTLKHRCSPEKPMKRRSTGAWPMAAEAPETTAVKNTDFLGSIGTLSAISVRGEKLEKTIECARYLGLGWFRAGIEGNIPMSQYVELHRQAGVRFSWGFGSGGSDLGKLIETGRQMAAA